MIFTLSFLMRNLHGLALNFTALRLVNQNAHPSPIVHFMTFFTRCQILPFLITKIHNFAALKRFN